MSRFIIQNCQPLEGTVKISGSKNSVLPVLAAALLTDHTCTFYEIPQLSDVCVMRDLLHDLGADAVYDPSNHMMTVTAHQIQKLEAAYELVGRMRASFLLMGPMLARFGKVRIPLPGGCAIGARPVDLHLKGFSALGAEVIQEHGYIAATADKLVGSNIYLDFPSVGATENIMMAATLAHGQTIIENCAVEPEIVDLANFINAIGGEVRGAGTDTVRINGVRELHGAEHAIIPDRIEAGTFMIATAITKGDVTLENVVVDHLKPIIAKLREANVSVHETETGLRVNGKGERIGVDIKTLPYPGFPTDMQAQFMSLLAVSEGTSIVTETVYENRFMHVGELKRMGAEIKIESRSAVVEGVEGLMGTQVRATDLRAGAALIVSALAAKGTTEISDIHHIERGYFQIDQKLRGLGAHIVREE